MLTVRRGSAARNVRKALVCRQFRPFYWWGALFRPCTIPRVLLDRRLLVLFGGASGEVVSPIASGEIHPADGGGDVHAEQVRDDRGWEVGCEGHEGAVAGRAGADAVAVEPVGEAVVVDGLSGNASGEQPVWSVRPVVDHEPGRWSSGQLPHDRGEAGR